MKITKHILYWLGIICLLSLLFGQESNNYQQAFFFASLLMPVALGTTYFFIYYLIPEFLLKKRFFLFALYFVYTLILSLYLEMLSAVGAFVLYANYQYENMNSLSTDVVTLGITIFFIVFASAFGQLLLHYFQQEETLDQLTHEKIKNEREVIQVRSERKNIPIKISEITYIESLSDYVKIHTINSSIITKEKISYYDMNLPSYFIRIHRSYLVNSNSIESFTKEYLSINKQQLPISRTYKSSVINSLMRD